MTTIKSRTRKFISHNIAKAIRLSLLKPLMLPALTAATLLPSYFVLANPNTAAESGGEESIERIIVTADLSDKDLSELPSSAIILSQEQIQQRQARHLQDLIGMAPNVNFSSGASRGKFIQIRGIGERSQFAEPINPSIGLLLDDIDISGLGGLATVFDLQQTEVLSGPQSVSTGLNSLGGIVKLVSNAPTDTRYLDLSASYAQYNEHRLGLAYSNALTDTLNARFSVQNTQSDGFVENIFLGRDDTNGIDETTMTARFNLEISDETQLDLNIYHFDIDNGYDAFTLDNDNLSRSDEPGRDTMDAQAASIKLSHDFSAHRLQAVLSAIDAQTEYGYDEDWTFVGFHPFEYSSFDLYERDINRRAFDIKLASKDSLLGNANYLVGVNLSRHDEELTRIYTFASDYSSEYSPNTSSVYGHYEHTISENLGLSIAARAEKFEADFFDNQGALTQIDDTLFAASLAFDYQLDQTSVSDTLLYASVSRGYKAGGFNIDQRLSADSRAYDPEFNINYEMGLKSKVLDGLGQLNLSFFFMQRDDAQVSDFVVFNETLDDGTVVPSFADAIGNADSGTNKGIELSSTWDMSQDWLLVANLGYLNATFGNYTQLDGTLVPTQDQAQAPKYTGYVSSRYLISDQISWFLDFEFKDEYRFSDGHDERAPFTPVLNSEITWQSYPFTISLWVKNLFDRDIYTRGFGGFSNDPREEYATPEPYYQFGQFRQVGMTFTYTLD